MILKYKIELIKILEFYFTGRSSFDIVIPQPFSHWINFFGLYSQSFKWLFKNSSFSIVVQPSFSHEISKLKKSTGKFRWESKARIYRLSKVLRMRGIVFNWSTSIGVRSMGHVGDRDNHSCMQTFIYKLKNNIFLRNFYSQFTWQKVCSHIGAWTGSCKTPPQIEPWNTKNELLCVCVCVFFPLLNLTNKFFIDRIGKSLNIKAHLLFPKIDVDPCQNMLATDVIFLFLLCTDQSPYRMVEKNDQLLIKCNTSTSIHSFFFKDIIIFLLLFF